MFKVLVSGTSSGLGHYLKSRFSADHFQKNLKNHQKTSFIYDLVIHAGFGRPSNADNPENFISSAVDVLQEIRNIQCKNFIFISSIECFKSTSTTYRDAKLECERLLHKEGNSLIIRLPSIYGPNMQKNQILKIATEKTPILSLSKDSTFSLLSYEQIYDFIRLNVNHRGMKTLMSSIVSLSEISKCFSAQPRWGEFNYVTPVVDSATIIDPGLMISNYKKFVKDSISN